MATLTSPHGFCIFFSTTRSWGIMSKKNRDTTASDESVEKRRSAVRKILAAGSVTAGAGISTWKTPVIESVVLPAHAQTTGPGIGGQGAGSGGQSSVLSGQIGESQIAGLLDLFLSPAYAEEESDLVGGCIKITIAGISITVTVTLNNSVSDTKSGTVDDCTLSFTVANVNGYTVAGVVDDLDNPTTCEGSVGAVEFSAVLNGSCTVIPASTTTTACVPDGTTSCD